MPRVLTKPVQIKQDVEEILFCDFARLQRFSFTYPKDQYYISLKNFGDYIINIHYNGKSDIVEPSESLEINESISEFQVYCSEGSAGFEARSLANYSKPELISQKILYMNHHPLINTYNCYASLFSIVPINEENKAWFYSNFIQICYDYNYNWYFFENHNILDTCPWLENYKLRREMIHKGFSSIQNFLIDAINDDFYCYLIVNLYYIPAAQYYGNTDFSHEIMIYGYDLINKEFYIANNFSGGKYILSRCSFDQMEKAFNTVSFDWIDICMYRHKAIDYKVDFNKRYFVNSLKSYITGQPSILQPSFPSWWTYDCKYGLGVYQHLIETVKSIPEEDYLDKRVFHLLQEHKQFMLLRLEYIQEYLNIDVSDYIRNYSEMRRSSILLNNLVLKYNFTKNKNLLDKIITYIKDIMKQEDAVIRNMLLIFNDC